ncbi:PucR family transcriptional regulator [Nocardia sp. NPDC101769]|uniref:PucR family transcriptional regulator n=1 Tax=Nocardia sp. NPDC101769 TaxID=3364333 RepID=UPI00381E8F59
MEELLQRLAALDPAAEDAVHAISYFDRLMERRAGLDSFIRAAAILSGCPAGLHDPDRHLTIRIHPDGHRIDPAPHSDAYATADLGGGSTGYVWLEREAPALPTDRIILERLAVGATVVLDRTRGTTPGHDPASVEALLSAETGSAARRLALRRLALPAELRVRVVASLPDHPGSDSEPAVRWTTRIGRVHAAVIPADIEPTPAARAGVGPIVTAAELPRSWTAALRALRLTGEPGPRLLSYDDLGGWALVADRISADEALIEDVHTLRAARDQLPDALETLTAIAETDSLRRAAEALFIHHSTLQARLRRLIAVLGYRPDTASGRTRLHLALALHRINLNGPLP